MIRNILILGGGSAGLLAALTLKRRLPALQVHLVRSPEISAIGVGEGTTQLLPAFLFDYLGLPPGPFYAQTQPTWKLGIRFLWGPRPHFHYTFSQMIDRRWPELPKNHGFYAAEDFENMDLWSGLMAAGKALPRDDHHQPCLLRHKHLGFHVENSKLIDYLEARCREFGAEIIDGTVSEIEPGPAGLSALLLADGRRLVADLFLDASGFRSELLGRRMTLPFVSYTDTLFCDRAVIGGWARTSEPIQPFTTAETMSAGWCWQIEHEHWINRGYVFSSRFLSDEAALTELRLANPKMTGQPRAVAFRSGRYAAMWSGNVIGIGNASGFVEPLEASALQCIILQCRTLAETLADSDLMPPPSAVAIYNRLLTGVWDDVRDFLAIHYRFNTRLNTPFWQLARAETALHGAEGLVEFYRENGPSSLGKSLLLSSNNPYSMEGYLALLVGQKVPHARPYQASERERRQWQRRQQEFILAGKLGFTVKEALSRIRQPGWQWA